MCPVGRRMLRVSVKNAIYIIYIIYIYYIIYIIYNIIYNILYIYYIYIIYYMYYIYIYVCMYIYLRSILRDFNDPWDRKIISFCNLLLVFNLILSTAFIFLNVSYRKVL